MLRPIFAAFCVVSSPLAQNEILHYKFDEGSGTTVINHAVGSPAPATAAISGANAVHFNTGRTGGSLAANSSSTAQSYVDSGWTGGFSGDFSVAWFMRLRGTPGTALSYWFSNIGSFRAFTNGAAGTNILVRAWGGSPADLRSTTDVQAAAANDWLHLALVVDTVAGFATFYMDGVPETPIAITGTAGATDPTDSFRVSGHTSLVNYYDMDDFRFVNRAVTPTEVLIWALDTPAATGGFGVACGVTLEGAGAPTLGSATFQMQGTGPANSAGIIGLGLEDVSATPIDLGLLFPYLTGCPLHSSLALSIAFGVTGAGTYSSPLPISSDPLWLGLNLYNQSITLDAAGQLATSNGLVVSIGT